MEDLYMWKDMLMVLFNLIDYNHSGTNKIRREKFGDRTTTFVGFISRNEFADVIKLVLRGESDSENVDDAYVEELTSAMDFDRNGKIDVNEFLESFRIVNVKNTRL